MANRESTTKPTNVPVSDYLEIVTDKKREDSYILIDMMKEITGLDPVMWGASMIGFGEMRYESSTCMGSMPILAFAPRKAKFSIYLGDSKKYEKDLASIGKHTTGVGCLYVNKLSDIDLSVLEAVLKDIWKEYSHHA